MNIVALLDETLSSLKDFQKATVDALMQHFKCDGNQRMLVADEVGLGKTIVAKGIIAELLKLHLKTSVGDDFKPLRVTYICSNLTLANENRNKLAVFSGDAHAKYVQEPSYSRLLEVALLDSKPADDEKILELCSLTPSTSFSMTGGDGNWKERLIVLMALVAHSDLESYKQKISNLMSNRVKNWSTDVKRYFENHHLVYGVVAEFHCLLDENISLEEIYYCGIEGDFKSWKDVLVAYCCNEITFPESRHARRFRSYLRLLLARACAKNLTADLFILDEFQRFKSLLDTTIENDESLVAREIFNSGRETKILLLSATPFKAISQASDDENGDAHAQELNYLLKFISNSDQTMLDEYEKNRHAMQQQILALRDPTYLVSSLSDKYKIALENSLRNYICRTERAQITKSYDEILVSSVEKSASYFSSKDIDVFRAIDQLEQGLQEVSRGRQASQLMEFYKSAPWPLSFLSGYTFKKNLDKHREHELIKGPLRRSDAAWISRTTIQKYQLSLDNSAHAKTRALVGKIFDTPSEELLWVPPSLPNYPLQGSFEGQENFSKTLLFSSWAMVPRALSGLISYEAERRLLLNQKGVEKTYYKKASPNPKIKFDSDASLSGWSLVYPSKIMNYMPIIGIKQSLFQIIADRIKIFQSLLNSLECYAVGAGTRDRWYAMAPLLLDLKAGHQQFVNEWLRRSRQTKNLGRQKQLEDITIFLDCHEELQLGPMPDDLPEYLAKLSIASPSISVYRTWQRNWSAEIEIEIAMASSEVAFAFIAMMNKPESESVLNKLYRNEKYFKAVLDYCVDGGFQALIDEYGHMLKDAGLPMQSQYDDNYSATGRLKEVLGFRTSTVSCQFREDKRKSSEITTEKANNSQKETMNSLRCHYAVPLGNQKTTDEQGNQRISNVRDAFNSPFRPFMLNSTSIGQEGLDFHWYCHQVIHWNLPSNPIDIEQREGRVNRYKSLVVRKRIAQKFSQYVKAINCDPWLQLFTSADEITKKEGRESDLVPYWYYPEGAAKIERFIPMMPMSKDVAKLKNALKILAIYRLAFGQPRQEELLENLLQRDFPKDVLEEINKALVINLSPLRYMGNASLNTATYNDSETK